MDKNKFDVVFQPLKVLFNKAKAISRVFYSFDTRDEFDNIV